MAQQSKGTGTGDNRRGWMESDQPLFEVPNLDGLSVDAGDYLHAAHVFSLLASYAEHKGRAMELREQGDIEAALSHERCCEQSYKLLPAWACW